jgi:hypothetical protein
MAQLRSMVCGAVALATSAVLASPAAAIVGERQILDGCEVGGGGNDIFSVHSRYDADQNEIVVTLRLCSEARRTATYRVHLDHAAPFVGEAAAPLVAEATAPATCDTPADSVVARTPGGHQGVGASEVEGNQVRFVVPLDDLNVGEPEDVPLIPLWATSTLGGTVDRAPTAEAGDDCAHPQARTETLVQPRIEITNLVWITSFTTSGLIGGGGEDAIGTAISVCTQEAQSAGFTNTDDILSWLSDVVTEPASLISNPGSVGPIQTADGTTIADTFADLLSCDPDGSNDCLLAPIDRDVHGVQVDPGTLTWTGTEPDGTSEFPNCSDWDSNSASDEGSGGSVGRLDALWTSASLGTCDEIRHLICFLLDPTQLD